MLCFVVLEMRQGGLKIQEIGGFGNEFEFYILKVALEESFFMLAL